MRDGFMRRVTGLSVMLMLAALAAAAGCSSARLATSKVNPDFKGRRYSKVMVMGVTSREKVRHVFEDGFADALRERGVEAVPSYTLIPQSGRADEAAVKSAVERAGAQALLVTRLVSREQRSEVRTMPAPTTPRRGMHPGYYGEYSGAWVNYYDPVDVYEYEVVILESRLIDAGDAGIAWNGSTEVVPPGDLSKGVKDLAAVIVKELQSKGLITGK